MKLLNKKKTLIAIAIVIIIFFAVPMAVVGTVYDINFGNRIENRWNLYEKIIAESPDFKREPISFSSNKGQILRGNLYCYDKSNYKALIVISHGYGRGADSYAQEAEFFARNGYLVMSYDDTGTNDSDGDSLIGVSQSPIDLDYALRFVEQNEDLNKYTIMLYGHSWGGFAATAVNNYNHHIKAIASISGLENTSNLVKRRGEQMMGDLIYLFLPYGRLYEYMKFGKAAGNTGIKGLKQTDAKVLIVHSEDDVIVPFEDSYVKYINAFQGDPRITFKLVTKYGHNPMVSLDPKNNLQGVRRLDTEKMQVVVNFYDKALLQ